MWEWALKHSSLFQLYEEKPSELVNVKIHFSFCFCAMSHFSKGWFGVQCSRKGALLSENQLLKCSCTDGWAQEQAQTLITDRFHLPSAVSAVVIPSSAPHFHNLWKASEVEQELSCISLFPVPALWWWNTKCSGTSVLASMARAALCRNMILQGRDWSL